MGSPDPANSLADLLGLLGALPRGVEAFPASGGSFPITVLRTADGLLHALAPRTAVAEDLVLEVRLEAGDGEGFAVALRVAAVFFHSGEQSLVHLEAIELRARPTKRVAPRAAIAELALARVLFGAELERGVEFDVRLADVSATGVAFVTERRLHPGDMLALMGDLGGRLARMEVRVVRGAAAHYGRSLIGCEITKIGDADRAALAAMATGEPEASRSPAPAASGLLARLRA